jgi:hypothetical protein
MKIDAEMMAKEFYEARNPSMKWSSLVWWEKLHMAVLAEREACAEYVAQSFENELVSGKDAAAAIRARGKV